MKTRFMGRMGVVVRTGVALVCVLGAGVYAADSETVLRPGTAAPPFSLPDLTGKRQALRVWCGDTLIKPHINSTPHTIILNFWATYCKPCQKEIPQIMQFMKKHGKEPVKAYCITIDKEGATKVKPFIKEKGYRVPVLLDPYARTAQRYGVKSVPALFVVAPNGRIHYSAMGYDEKVNLDEKLEKILAEIKAGKRASSDKIETVGETVAVRETATGTAPPAARDPAGIPPRERWRAVMRLECGENIEDVAHDMGVGAQQIEAWRSQLKSAAVKIWGKKKAPAPAK